jgi:hypothetical protein
MTEIYALAALWLGLTLAATLLSIWLRVSTALSEIVVGTIAQLIIGAIVGSSMTRAIRLSAGPCVADATRRCSLEREACDRG